MHIRSFQNHDRAPLSALFLNTRKLSWPWLDSSKWGLSDFEKYTDNEMILVAEKDQVYLGFASIYLQENFLHHLFIAPNAQNQGAGTALLHTAEQLFTGTGYLKCLSENKQALSFYLDHGWEAISTGVSEEGGYILMSKAKLIQ